MIKTLYFTLFVCAFAFLLFACSDKSKDDFKNLSSDEFERLIEDENVQCVDVRIWVDDAGPGVPDGGKHLIEMTGGKRSAQHPLHGRYGLRQSGSFHQII